MKKKNKYDFTISSQYLIFKLPSEYSMHYPIIIPTI